MDPKWQPIETASKDGAQVLAYWKGAEPYAFEVVRWAGDDWMCLSHEVAAPTHWQPLPPPPGEAA